MSTIFISHSSKDNEVARDLERRLAERNHASVFLDLDPEKGIVAGQSWERTLYCKLRACRAVIALLTDDYLTSHWCFAEIALARMEGKHVIALKVDGLTDDERLPSILMEKQYIDLRSDPEAGYELLWRGLLEEDILGIGGSYDPRKKGPYLGLAAFEEEHAAMFFGREAETRAGLEALERGAPGLTVVLGASGTGKSSLVRAGMVPRLRRDPDRWILVDPIRPGVDPFVELANALEGAYSALPGKSGVRVPTAEEIARRLKTAAAELPRHTLARDPVPLDDTAPDSVDDDRLPELIHHLESLRQDPPPQAEPVLLDFLNWSLEDLKLIVDKPDRTAAESEPQPPGRTALLSVVRHLRRTSGHPHARVLLIVDQFEELLTHADQENAERFLRLIRASVEADRSTLMVLATMRSDFLEVFQRNPALRGIQYGSLSLGPVRVDAMRRIIEKPADLADIRLEPGLADRLLEDTETEDALPLLSFTLWKMYRDYIGPRDRDLDLAEYDDLGGIHGAIAKEAEVVLEVARNQGVEDDLRRAFVRMAGITEDGSYARRRARVADPEIARVEKILRLFAERRLLVFRKEDEDEVVEVAHEALFRSWAPLKGWLDDRRAELLLQEQIRRDAEAWDAEDRSADQLWRGSRLLQARDVMREPGRLKPQEEEFVRSGLTRRRRLRVAGASFVTVVFTVVSVAAVVALRARDRAEDSSRFAIAGEWLATGDPTNAALALLELDAPGSIRGATARMADAIAAGVAILDLRHGDGVLDARFSPDGNRVVTAGRDGRALIWDARVGVVLDTLCCHDDQLSSAAFSPDGRRVVTAGGPDVAILWDVSSGDQLAVLEHPEWVNSARFGPDGRIVTASDDGVIRIWSDEGTVVDSLVGHDGGVNSAVFDVAGQRVLTAGADGTARIWDAAHPARLMRILEEGTQEMISAEFSPDGRRVVTAGGDGMVRIWDLDTDESLLLQGHALRVNSAAFSPDGRTVVTSSHDHTTRLWDAEGEPIRVIRTHTEFVFGAVFSPEGDRIATAGDDRRVLIWETTPPIPQRPAGLLGAELVVVQPGGDRLLVVDDDGGATLLDDVDGGAVRTLEVGAGVSAAAFSPAGDRIAIADETGTRIWDATGGEVEVGLEGQPGPVSALNFSPDGAWIIAASGTTARVWNAGTGRLRDELAGHGDMVTSVLLDAAGRHAVTTSRDSTARIWDLDEGTSVVLEAHHNWVNSATFGPRGRLVTTGDDAKLRFWDPTSGDSLDTFVQHRNWVGSAEYNGDGSWLLTTENGEAAQIWDVESGIRLWRQVVPDLERAVFLGGGERVLTLSGKRGAEVWELGQERLWEMVEDGTRTCMPAEVRRQVGIQSRRAAQQDHAACERRQGRLR